MTSGHLLFIVGNIIKPERPKEIQTIRTASLVARLNGILTPGHILRRHRKLWIYSIFNRWMPAVWWSDKIHMTFGGTCMIAVSGSMILTCWSTCGWNTCANCFRFGHFAHFKGHYCLISKFAFVKNESGIAQVTGIRWRRKYNTWHSLT